MHPLPILAAAAAGILAGGDGASWGQASQDGLLVPALALMAGVGALLIGSAGMLAYLILGPSEGTRG